MVERTAAALERLELPLVGVFTYFVNELRSGHRSTPYSTVAGIGPLTAAAEAELEEEGLDWRSVVPADLAGDELVLGAWLADDLRAGPGDPVELSYYVPGADRRLVEVTHGFRVRGTAPVAGLAADRGLMPDFPGLADSENCRDWEPGIPIDLDRIRDVDEAYWDTYRGTPKAFLSLAAARSFWSGRFGELTAVRASLYRRAALEEGLRAELDPAAVGLFFRDVRTPALAASRSATDFGGLFLGLSLFLIAAPLLLTALLFAFSVEQRSREIGLLLALDQEQPAHVARQLQEEFRRVYGLRVPVQLARPGELPRFELKAKRWQ